MLVYTTIPNRRFVNLLQFQEVDLKTNNVHI